MKRKTIIMNELIKKKIPNCIEGYPDIVVHWSEYELKQFDEDPNYIVEDNKVYIQKIKFINE